MGERSLRRLLIIGAGAVVRWAVRKPPPEMGTHANFLNKTVLGGRIRQVTIALW
jgi:hypothetical protein